MATDVVIQTRDDTSRVLKYVNKSNPLAVSVTGFNTGGSAASDAFGRLRISDSFTQFDWKNTNPSEIFSRNIFWDTQTVNGGSISVVTNGAAVRLSTGGVNSNGSATIQTKQAFTYQPGKSRLVLQTFVMGSVVSSGVAEIGYGDINDGVFLQRSGNNVNLVLRTAVSGSTTDGTVVPQSAWNADKFDGTGPSGITLDLTKTNILAIDLEWLGVGSARVFFIINNQFYLAHSFNNANAISVVYMRSGSLPVRARVYNNAQATGAMTMDVICTSVISEGGYTKGNYPQFSASTGITSQSTSSSSYVCAIALRPKTVFNNQPWRGHIVPSKISLLATAQTHEYRIVKNADINGGSWVDADSINSAAQYNINSGVVSGGILLDSGYIVASQPTSNTEIAEILQNVPIVITSLNNTVENVAILVKATTSTGTVLAAITWIEEN